jgi:alpha-1,2-mannosyltransferase
MELKRPSLTPRGLLATGSLVLLATTVVWTWLTLLPPGTVPSFFDLDSYRDTLDAVAGGALMFDWLGYPPVTLILLSPLRGLPELAGDQLWTGTSFVMILALAATLSKLAIEARAASDQRARHTFLVMFGFAGALLFPSEPMSNQLVSGQLSLTIVTLAFLDASGLLPRKWQGSLVGLAAAFKLTPLIFFPYYLITRQWRQAGVAAASFCVATGVGFVLFPRDSLYFWTHTDSSGRLGTNRIDNVSVLGTLSRWMADPAQTKLVWYGFALVIGLAAFWRAWQHYRRHEQVEAALVIGCASTAVSPIAWPHYQIWLVLAALWLILSGARRSMIIGALIYLVYSLLFAVPVVGAIAASEDPSKALIPRILWELNVLVPVLISVLGLPRRVTKGAGSEPAADLGSRQPVVPAAVVG